MLRAICWLWLYACAIKINRRTSKISDRYTLHVHVSWLLLLSSVFALNSIHALLKQDFGQVLRLGSKTSSNFLRWASLDTCTMYSNDLYSRSWPL